MQSHSFRSVPWMRALPNKLTYVRIAAVPVLVLLYPLGFEWLNVFCAFVFMIAAVTDWFDGYLARKYDAVTPFGAILDQLADKLLVTAAFILLTKTGALPTWMGVTFICREIVVSGIRLMAAEQNYTISVNSFGKIKTAIQDLAIFCLFINRDVFEIPLRTIGMIAAWVALGYSLYSGYVYWHAFWTHSHNPQDHQSSRSL